MQRAPHRWWQCFSIKNNVNALVGFSDGRRVNLDVWRSLAMFLVYVFHCFYYARYTLSPAEFEYFYSNTPLLLKWVWAGDRGVDIFFVISGFLIGNMLLTELKNTGEVALKRFYFRRLMRLIPVYWLAMLLYFLVGADSYHQLWANTLFVNNMIPVANSAMAWCWSLAVEEQFYLILPLLLYWLRAKRLLLWLLIIGVLSLFVRALVLNAGPAVAVASSKSVMFDTAIFNQFFDLLYNNLYTRFGELIVGVVGAYLRLYCAEKSRSFLRSYAGKAAQGIAWCLFFSFVFYGGFQFDAQSIFYMDSVLIKNTYLVVNRLLFALSVVVIVLSVSLFQGGEGEKRCRLTVGRTIKRGVNFWGFFAKLSYSIYVFHPFVIFGFSQWVYKFYTPELAQTGVFYYGYMPLFVIITLLLSTIASVVIYLLVEKPFLNLREMNTRESTLAVMPAARAS